MRRGGAGACLRPGEEARREETHRPSRGRRDVRARHAGGGSRDRPGAHYARPAGSGRAGHPREALRGHARRGGTFPQDPAGHPRSGTYRRPAVSGPGLQRAGETRPRGAQRGGDPGAVRGRVQAALRPHLHGRGYRTRQPAPQCAPAGRHAVRARQARCGDERGRVRTQRHAARLFRRGGPCGVPGL